MRQEKEEWLRQKIEEDLEALAEEREKLLMELEELQDIDMPVEKLEDIHREIEVRRHTRLRAGIRLKALTVSAAAMVLILGMGVASTGSRLYVPKIFQQERGDEVTTKVNNSEAIASQYGNEYGEEEACREIEEKLGVISPRLVYKPEGMVLAEYEVIDDQNGAFIERTKPVKNGQILDSMGQPPTLPKTDDAVGADRRIFFGEVKLRVSVNPQHIG